LPASNGAALFNVDGKIVYADHGPLRAMVTERNADATHAERHPVGARVLRNTMASIVLRRGTVRS